VNLADALDAATGTYKGRAFRVDQILADLTPTDQALARAALTGPLSNEKVAGAFTEAGHVVSAGGVRSWRHRNCPNR
jgi:hypothetical protein